MPEERVFNISAGDWDTFINSPCWQFLRQVLMNRKLAILADLTKKSATESIDKVRELQNELVVTDLMITLPTHYRDEQAKHKELNNG